MNRRFVSSGWGDGVGKGCCGLTSCHIVGFGTAFALVKAGLFDLKSNNK